MRILSECDDLSEIEASLRPDFNAEEDMPLLVAKYRNLDIIFKYKKFLFNQHVESNPNCRWCPECSKTGSQTIAKQSETRRLSLVLSSGESAIVEKEPSRSTKHVQEIIQRRNELLE